MIGSRVVLVTDMVDSTLLTSRLGDERMGRIWTAHDRLARDLMAAHGGREVERTDGFLLLFDTVAGALRWAEAFHRALRGLSDAEGVSLVTRIGLHVGDLALLMSDAADVAAGAKPLEVEGAAKPVTTQVMSLATGGRTLLTADAVARLDEAGFPLVSVGHWRMKGVSEPVELFEAAAEGATFAPPSDTAAAYRVVRSGELWIPARQVPHNLPAERDAFVGRGADLRALAQLLEGDVRLVTVLGMGGTGKTRLVQRYGRTHLGDWPGGVWFCDLSEARGPDGIVAAVAQALGVPLGGAEPVALLGRAIAALGRCLVLLDNFEQVGRYAGDTLGWWLDRAPEAAFVVTTREVLGLPGEHALALAPLTVEDATGLFLARAHAARRDFVATAQDRQDIARLVALLDGLPLAIELAAARVRTMSPPMLLSRMGERFKLLASAGGRSTRQATLRGALDWSWDLLTDDERATLAQLSLFEGGFTLEAAEAVVAVHDGWVIDLVQTLVDKSLVVPSADGRFDLLVSVQEYAAEQLRTPGRFTAAGPELRVASEVRHGAWFGGDSPDDAVRRAARADLDNYVVATRRALERGDAHLAAANLSAAWHLLYRTGPFLAVEPLALGVEGLLVGGSFPGVVEAQLCLLLGRIRQSLGRNADAARWLERGLAAGAGTHVGPVLQAQLGRLAMDRGDPDGARRHFEAVLVANGTGELENSVRFNLAVLDHRAGRMREARAAYEALVPACRAAGDTFQEARILANLASAVAELEPGEVGLRAYRDALEATRRSGDRPFEISVLNNLSSALTRLGRLDEAEALRREALRTARAIGARFSEAFALNGLGTCAAERLRLDEAHALWSSSLDVFRDLGDPRGESSILQNLASLALDRGRMEEALALAEEGLAVARAHRLRPQEGSLLRVLGRALALTDPHAAVAPLEESATLLREAADHRGEVGARVGLGRVLQRLGRIDEARATLRAARELALTWGDVRQEGQAAAALASCAAEEGDFEEARGLLVAAEASLRRVEGPLQLSEVLAQRCGLERRAGAEGEAAAALARFEEALAHLPEESRARALEVLAEA